MESPLELLALLSRTNEAEWEVVDGPDSGVGVDFWYQHSITGAEAYLNLDQDHLTISVDGERIYDGQIS